MRTTYVYQCVPPLPEVASGDDTNRFSQLSLQRWRHTDHKTNELFFDRKDLILGQDVIAILVRPIPLYEILEVESAC